MSDKEKQIRDLIDEAEGLLQEAAELSVGMNKPFYFEGPAYGMGGWISSGEWQASSQSC